MPARARVVVEVHVHVQALPVAVLVRPAADVVGVVQQVVDAGHARDEAEELRRLQVGVQRAVAVGQLAHVHAHGLAADFAHLVERVPFLEIREFVQQAPAERAIEEVRDRDVTEGQGSTETLGELVGSRHHGRIDARHGSSGGWMRTPQSAARR